MKTFTCTYPQNLRDFTDFNYPQGSFCFARLVRDRDIKVNGVRVSKNTELEAGDTVAYYTTPKEESALTYNTVFEDENLLVADKFAGVSTEGLKAQLNERGAYFAVHRLDRNTSGLIVFAKTERAEAELLNAFKERRLKKLYIAVCRDCFVSERATLTAYLKKDKDAALVKIYDKPVSGALKIITEYKVAERKDGLALVNVCLLTGRTHQIRAHLAHIGCPVLGDEKYGDNDLNGRYGLRRQCLSACELRFSGLCGGLEYLNGRVFKSGFGFSLESFTLKKT